ncbi:M50 family metallopeptidase [Carboxylicivirga sp. RSCT41]|uniref:M50 family metallopeptidase n=1 Tax=Carboxylicivirga agarovorans TaxID=3417570 RepID=UPI003D34103F
MSKTTKETLILIGMFIIAILLWDTVVIYPIKIFVVMLHEISHGLMAELMGGDIVKIEINHMIGGSCTTAHPPGFWPAFMIASAGYIGSLILGAIIFLTAARTNYIKFLAGVIGVGSLIITYYVIKSGELFGILFCAGFTLFMFASIKYLPLNILQFLLKFIGLTSCLYVILDIKSDLISRTGIGSDADQIAQMTGIPSITIGILWLVIAIVVVYYMLKKSVAKGKSY